MRIGVSSSGRWWVSAGPLGWLLYLMLVLPVLAAWLVLWAAVRLAVAAARGIAWLVRRVHDAPAVPPSLRTPPGRR
jgi:hypothetical protein